MRTNHNQLHPEEIGRQLGTESTSATLEKVTTYCDLEVQKIELQNQPRIAALRHEGSLLLQEEQELTRKLQDAPSPCDQRSRRWRAAYYWSVTALLWAAGFFLLIYTFAPFRMGSIGILYCLGASAAVPFLFDFAFQDPVRQKWLQSLATIALVVGLASLMLLALIRGDLLVQELQSSGPAVIIDDPQSSTAASAQPKDFYEKTGMLLLPALLLLAFAMDVGAGLALREARRTGSEDSEDWGKLRARLYEVRHRLTEIVYEIRTLENEGQEFAAAFWADFYKAMLTHTLRNAMTKFLVTVIVFLTLFTPCRSYAAAKTNTVIAVDLTQSEAVKDATGKTEFAKNIDAVSTVLSQVSASSIITIIGITDHSFTQPYILLSATVPDDPGYFGERLRRARIDLVRAWKTRIARLAPTFKHTDIIGALFLASEILENKRAPTEKTLIIFSDMQNSTRDLNLESGTIPSFALLRDINVANLQDVQVRILGVDAPRTSLAYWEDLKNFWIEYFQETGAKVQNYEALHE